MEVLSYVVIVVNHSVSPSKLMTLGYVRMPVVSSAANAGICSGSIVSVKNLFRNGAPCGGTSKEGALRKSEKNNANTYISMESHESFRE
jgi:hypothetical protein